MNTAPVGHVCTDPEDCPNEVCPAACTWPPEPEPLPRVSPGGAAALRALYGAAIDPGELLWNELRVRVQTSDQGLARIANRLQADGLVVQEDWDGSKWQVVRLTDLGVAACKHLGYTAPHRT